MPNPVSKAPEEVQTYISCLYPELGWPLVPGSFQQSPLFVQWCLATAVKNTDKYNQAALVICRFQSCFHQSLQNIHIHLRGISQGPPECMALERGMMGDFSSTSCTWKQWWDPIVGPECQELEEKIAWLWVGCLLWACWTLKWRTSSFKTVIRGTLVFHRGAWEVREGGRGRLNGPWAFFYLLVWASLLLWTGLYFFFTEKKIPLLRRKQPDGPCSPKLPMLLAPRSLFKNIISLLSSSPSLIKGELPNTKKGQNVLKTEQVIPK